MIQLDASNQLREVIAKFDMVGFPTPAPAGIKIYANESWDGDEKFRNLHQQYCGCIQYAALIRPELSFLADLSHKLCQNKEIIQAFTDIICMHCNERIRILLVSLDNFERNRRSPNR